MKENIDYTIVYPDKTDLELLEQASALIHLYAEAGLMLDQTVEALASIAAQGMLALAVKGENVIGSVGYTFVWPDGKNELGAWAVAPEYINHGVGKDLLKSIAQKNGHQNVIAFGNHNSGPIFEQLGASILAETQMHPDAFLPCQTCQCDKTYLPKGRQCVDIIYDLSPVLTKLVAAS